MKGASANPLPVVWPSLAAKGVKVRSGQLTLIAGQPNAGKSAVAMALAIAMRLPTLYISADTDKFTSFVRGAACVTGDTQESVESALRTGNGDYYIGEVAEHLSEIRFTFDPSPSLEDIDLELRAFEEAWGCPPRLIVVDNLLNVVGASNGDHSGALEIVQALHHVAHSTDAAVLCLHHVSEGEVFEICPPRKAILNKVNQLPELILTVARHGDSMAIACVKNRNGVADASGKTAVFISADISRMQLRDQEPA